LEICGITCPHDHAHRAGAARHDAHRGFEICCIQVGHLRLGDFLDLLAGDLCRLVGVRRALPDSMPAAFLISTVVGGV